MVFNEKKCTKMDSLMYQFCLLSATNRARALHVRYASPLFTLKLFYCFLYLPHLLPPPTGHSLGRVIRRLEWIETMVQFVELTAELPMDDPRPHTCEDGDLEVSQIDTTWHTPRVPETTYGKVVACRH